MKEKKNYLKGVILILGQRLEKNGCLLFLVSTAGAVTATVCVEKAFQGSEGNIKATIAGVVLAGAGVVFGKSYMEDAMSYQGASSVADQQHTDLVNQRVFEHVTTRHHNY